MSTPEIKLYNGTDYEFKQSKYDNVGKLPIRQIFLAPSGSGKTVLLTNYILDIYKGMFERIYIFSPSIYVDHTWQPVKKYIKETIGNETPDDKFYYDSYDPEALDFIIDTQRKITEYVKEKGRHKLYNILIIIDDFADNPEFSRHSKLLHSLYTRGRHSGISTITSVQKGTALHPIIRVNCTQMIIYKLRNYSDLQLVIDELSALFQDKKTLIDIYNLATSEPFSFLYVDLSSKDTNKMFYINFNKVIQIKDN
jgi:hypothetical protein